ncbi:MAG TPA: bifunctional hydroxymethylpyrimidine kinase/phosphomethylpyrimidine kinase [Armatimonadetes bacterium]|nr:bifunctional hydroxymethylpyrimidine kinase/phosphomethylpyrimidine kinase [Armatimonadota bacterium]
MKPKVLTIAGSDSGGGAGIQADLKTFAALEVYGTSVLTALTAQNTQGVTAIHEVPPDFVAAQLDAVLSDLGADATKTGMLANAAIIEVVAAKVQEYNLHNLVVDPVMVAKSGTRLLREDAVTALKLLLLPLARVVTPNLSEAEVLAEWELRTGADFRRAAERIRTLGPEVVVLKGGHRPGGEVLDLLLDDEGFLELRRPRVDTSHIHGTGCTFSAAIAAYLARGQPVREAILTAKEYLAQTLVHAYPVGKGPSPGHHFWAWWTSA